MPEKLLVKPLIQKYYKNLNEIESTGYLHEGATRQAMVGLLSSMSPMRNLNLVQEVSRKPYGRKYPIVYDGILIRKRDQYDFGYWEAKDQNDQLDRAIHQKIQKGYSLVNTLFENTQEAVLYQDGKKVLQANMKNSQELGEILVQFFMHDQKIFDDFQAEKEQFSRQIEAQAQKLFGELEKRKKAHAPFGYELTKFLNYCIEYLNPDTQLKDVEKMLVQHILTERVFQEILLSSDILNYNRMGIAVGGLLDKFYDLEMRKKIDAVLRPYYDRIASLSRRMNDSESKQKLLIDVYEIFFREFSPNEADRLGVKYTPKEIVDFIVRSVDWALSREFGRSLGSVDTHILDPCVGTGTFMVKVLEEIAKNTPQNLSRKYREELHANEIELLPYYIATLNLQHMYNECTGFWEEFPGICFADSLDLLEPVERDLFFAEANAEQVSKQQKQKIFVILGNPPYNAWQKSENQANKNKKTSSHRF